MSVASKDSIQEQDILHTSFTNSQHSHSSSRRTTLDTITMSNGRESINVADVNRMEAFRNDRNSWAVSPGAGGVRQSIYYDDENRQRKSKIGGVFKRMFKKDE